MWLKGFEMNRHERTTRRKGFTLVELLVVVALLATLMAMLLPTLGRAKLLANVAKSRAWIHTLGDACEAYYHENSYYPGQQFSDQLIGSGQANSLFTGSQFLVRSFFTTLDKSNPAKINFTYDVAKTSYVTSKEADLMDPANKTIKITTTVDGTANQPFTPTPGWQSISSRLSNMPILYFPARLGVIGEEQYRWDDNGLDPYSATPYGGSAAVADPNLPAPDIRFLGPQKGNITAIFPKTGQRYPDGFITDSRLSPPRYSDPPSNNTANANYTYQQMTPHNPGKFILVGAGQDNVFFTKDDLIYPNWN